jgi:hypothetical protein
MRAGRVFLVGAVAALLALCVGTAAATAADTLVAKHPSFMTAKFRKQVRNAGRKGKPAPKGGQQGPGATDICPGVDTSMPQPAVSAGTCEVFPYGCTANFIYSNGSSFYIGTAGHCVDKVGQDIYMQVATPGVGASIADVGTVAKFVNGGVGNDYAVIAIKPGFAIDPKLPVGGPNGIYTGCGPEVVRNWSHGYGVAVAQGRPEGGVATNWYDDGYGWTGLALPGSSGSAVVTSSGAAAGDLTHLIVDPGAYPGSNVAGTRITKILAGTGLSLVNADGSLARATSTSCGAQPREARAGSAGSLLGSLL